MRIHGVKLVVKPHPREDRAAYRAISDITIWDGASPSELLARARAAIVGISTVVEEASLMGVPVLALGHSVHGERFATRLPDPKAYPRIESASALVEQISG